MKTNDDVNRTIGLSNVRFGVPPSGGGAHAILSAWKISQMVGVRQPLRLKPGLRTMVCVGKNRNLLQPTPALQIFAFSVSVDHGWRRRKNSGGEPGTPDGKLICEFVIEVGTSTQAAELLTPATFVWRIQPT